MSKDALAFVKIEHRTNSVPSVSDGFVYSSYIDVCAKGERSFHRITGYGCKKDAEAATIDAAKALEKVARLLGGRAFLEDVT